MNTNAKLLAIKAEVFEQGLKYNQEPSDTKITAYAKDLMDYTPEQIRFAFKQVRKSGSAFFPSLPEIEKHLIPAEDRIEDQAVLIMKEIMLLIQLHHPMNEEKLVESASDDARAVLMMMGGTNEIRNAPLENLGTTQAQLRDFARGVLGKKVTDAKNAKLESIGINTGQVLEFPKNEMKAMDYSNFLPGEKA